MAGIANLMIFAQRLATRFVVKVVTMPATGKDSGGRRSVSRSNQLATCSSSAAASSSLYCSDGTSMVRSAVDADRVDRGSLLEEFTILVRFRSVWR